MECLVTRAKVDFQVVNHGTIYLVYPNTRRAKQWLKDNLPQDHTTYNDASVVEHRYIGDIIDGIQTDGLDVAVSRSFLPCLPNRKPKGLRSKR